MAPSNNSRGRPLLHPSDAKKAATKGTPAKARAVQRRRTPKRSLGVSGTGGGSVSSFTSISTPDFNNVVRRTVNTGVGMVAPSPSTITTDGSYSKDELEAERHSKVCVSLYVAQYIFPHLKFLDGSQFNLLYSTDSRSLCNLIARNCFRGNTMTQQWWDAKGRGYVRAAISRLRSDKMQAIKKAFNGKFITCAEGCMSCSSNT